MNLRRAVTKITLAFLLAASVCAGCTTPSDQSDATAHTVIAYWQYNPYCPSVMCHPDYFYGILHIPLLTVYDNGRVLFECPDKREETATLCQNRVAPDRIQKLLADIREAGQDYLYKGEYPPEVGPQNLITLIISTANDTVRVKWSTSSHTMPLRSVVEILDSFIEEVQAGRQVYEPEYVALWIKRPIDCTSATDSYPCSSLNDFPAWPFDFAPPYQQLEQIHTETPLEFPQPFARIRMLS